MMIALSKSTMNNSKYVAGLLLMLFISTDTFANNNFIKISSSPGIYSIAQKPIFYSPLQSSLKNTDKKEHTTNFYALTPFFQDSSKRPYINDGVKFTSSKQSFVDLGVDLTQTAQFIKEVGQIYDTVFKNEIDDLFSSNKMMIIKVKISNNQEKMCSANCSQIKITFHSADSFGNEITIFSKKVRELSPIYIKNNKSTSSAEFQIYLNTKPKNFLVQERMLKSPTLSVSPFSNRG